VSRLGESECSGAKRLRRAQSWWLESNPRSEPADRVRRTTALPGVERVYNILNMRSTRSVRESTDDRSPHDTAPDDRSTRARIRDAAIDCFAELGIAATTVRKVAAAAGVSTGLVIHYFGSMDGLRAECDDFIAADIRQRKTEALSTGPGADPLAAMRDSKVGPLMRYLARALAEDSPSVNTLVDEMVADAEEYLQRGVENGTLRPSTDPRGQAAVLTMWSLGALVLHRHLERILGVDITAPHLAAGPALTAYAGPALEILSQGMLTESFARTVRESLVASPVDDAGTAPPAPPAPPPPRTSTKKPVKGLT